MLDMKDKKYAEYRVKSSSPVETLSKSLVISVTEGKEVELKAVGANAVNQAIKACAAARGLLASKGFDVYVIPGFFQLMDETDGKQKTGVLLKLLVR